MKLNFKDDYFKAEGILLDLVIKNPGLRAFAKAMLNCLWGKYAQNNTMTETEYISDIKYFLELMQNPDITVHSLELFDHCHFLLASYTDKNKEYLPHESANVPVAAYVTAYARLVLYGELSKLGNRVLYFDTDSCLYIKRPNTYDIPIINGRLGCWADEVPLGKIVEYVGLGPTNYGYKYIDTNGSIISKCKVKGITLDYNTSEIINFDSMVDCANDRENYATTIYYNSKIKRNRDRTVTNEHRTKLFRSVYTKRIIINRFDTISFGYHK